MSAETPKLSRGLEYLLELYSEGIEPMNREAFNGNPENDSLELKPNSEGTLSMVGVWDGEELEIFRINTLEALGKYFEYWSTGNEALTNDLEIVFANGVNVISNWGVDEIDEDPFRRFGLAHSENQIAGFSYLSEEKPSPNKLKAWWNKIQELFGTLIQIKAEQKGTFEALLEREELSILAEWSQDKLIIHVLEDEHTHLCQLDFDCPMIEPKILHIIQNCTNNPINNKIELLEEWVMYTLTEIRKAVRRVADGTDLDPMNPTIANNSAALNATSQTIQQMNKWGAKAAAPLPDPRLMDPVGDAYRAARFLGEWDEWIEREYMPTDQGTNYYKHPRLAEITVWRNFKVIEQEPQAPETPSIESPPELRFEVEGGWYIQTEHGLEWYSHEDY